MLQNIMRPLSLKTLDVTPVYLLLSKYDNDYSLIIDIYYYETFSTLTQTFSACAQLFTDLV
jgi:hypothetical protein